MWKRWGFLLGLLLFSVPVYSATLTLSAPPRESKQAGEKLYTPLADFLSQFLGKKVVYQHPGNWLKYQREMRADKYDFVFDGPHFAAWRMAHLGHKVLVKLPGRLQFHLLTNADNKAINSPMDMVGKNICGISPPNLSTLSILEYYSNPVRQPIIKGVKGGMGKVYAVFKGKKCQALVLRTTFYNKKLKQADRQSLKIIYSSEALPNQVITASKRISQDEREKIQQALLRTQKGKQALAPILKRFGGKAKSFMLAKSQEYEGNNKLLEGVIFGW